MAVPFSVDSFVHIHRRDVVLVLRGLREEVQPHCSASCGCNGVNDRHSRYVGSSSMSVGETKRRMPPNHGLEGSAQQLRCWVPVALRAPAPPQPGR